MFTLETEKANLKLEIVRVDDLLMHEEILPGLAEHLFLEFKNWAHLQDPIIIDENNIVLDGNHRAHVFRKLKLKYIAVCRIDYFRKEAKLRYWFRLLGNVGNLEKLEALINDMGGRLEKVADQETLSRRLAADHLCCGLQQSDDYLCIYFPHRIVNDAVSAYSLMHRIQDRLEEIGISIEYIPCRYVRDQALCNNLGTDRAILWTPRITKEMVVAAAKNRQRFKPKTTRHVIPARPLRVNVSTMWLNEDISLERINQRFTRFLDNKQYNRFGPGQIIDGRFYAEEVFIFYDKG